MTYVLAAVESMSIGEALNISILGIVVGFIVLVSLMFIVYLMRFVIGNIEQPKTAKVSIVASKNTSPEMPASIQAAPKMIPAKGSIGEISLHMVDDKTAAILMAIVADEIGAPLNELRFKSVREIQPDTPDTALNGIDFDNMFDAAVQRKTDYK